MDLYIWMNSGKFLSGWPLHLHLYELRCKESLGDSLSVVKRIMGSAVTGIVRGTIHTYGYITFIYCVFFFHGLAVHVYRWLRVLRVPPRFFPRRSIVEVAVRGHGWEDSAHHVRIRCYIWSRAVWVPRVRSSSRGSRGVRSLFLMAGAFRMHMPILLAFSFLKIFSSNLPATSAGFSGEVKDAHARCYVLVPSGLPTWTTTGKRMVIVGVVERCHLMPMHHFKRFQFQYNTLHACMWWMVRGCPHSQPTNWWCSCSCCRCYWSNNF